jgi:oligosaccharyltransferase complex subunit delta (ribophorin II)
VNVSTPKPEDPERWAPKPEITHTFRTPQKLPNNQLSGLFAVAVVAGLPLFLLLVQPLKARAKHQLYFASANVSSWSTAIANTPISHAIFFASLLAFEIRFFKYWVGGTLGRILLETAGIAVVAFISGKRALGEVMQRKSKSL